MKDQKINGLILSAKRTFIYCARPFALGVLAFTLSTVQGYFIYPNLVIAIIVFVLAGSSFAQRAAYIIIFYLAFLVLLPPEVAGVVQKGIRILVVKWV